MSFEPYLSETEGASIKDEFFKLFLTSKEIGTVFDVTFSRDTDTGPINIDYTDVLLTLAARQPDVVNNEAAVATRTQGRLAREVPFDPKPGDLFVLQGQRGRVVTVYPEMNRIVRADIFFDNPYG